MDILKGLSRISFFFLIILAANGILGGVIIALLQTHPQGSPLTPDLITKGYSIHFELLLALSDPLMMNLTTAAKTYAVFDAIASWLVVPTIFAVVIDKILAFRQELQIVTDKVKSRISAYEAIKRGLCPSCGERIDFFDEPDKRGFVCMNCGEAMVEAKIRQKNKG